MPRITRPQCNCDEMGCHNPTSASEDIKLKILENKLENKFIPKDLKNSISTVAEEITDQSYLYIDSDGTPSKIDAKAFLAFAKAIKFEKVAELPEIGDSNIIYLVARGKEEEKNVYDEFIYVDNHWEKIGSTDIDLSDYTKFSDVQDMLLGYASKADLAEVETEVAKKADTVYVNDVKETLEESIDSLETAINTKADKTELDAKVVVLQNQIDAKQDVISDLGNIREGAALGKTAVQPEALENYNTKAEIDAKLNQKQDVLSAGENITITGTTISAKDTTYSDGYGLSLAGGIFSVDSDIISSVEYVDEQNTQTREYADQQDELKQDKLTAGENIEISDTNIIKSNADKLKTSITATVDIGGVTATDIFAAGSSVEDLLRKLLSPEIKLTGIAIKNPPTKVEYDEGDLFDKTGMVVEAIYNVGPRKEITSYTVTPVRPLVETDTYVTISYTEGGITKVATQDIVVAPPMVTIYYGATDDIPESLSELTSELVLKNTLLNKYEKLYITGHGEGPYAQGQYPVLAIPNNYTLTSWEIPQMRGTDIPHTKKVIGTYSVYYLDEPTDDRPDGTTYVFVIE